MIKISYELWKGRLAMLNYLKLFGSKCYIKISEEKLGKFDSRIDEGIFQGYSYDNKAYILYYIKFYKRLVSTNVKVDDEKSYSTN
jgi:hypothetical protein